MAAQCIETTVTVCHSLSQCISRQRHEDANAFIITHNSMSDDITNVSSQIPITHTSMFLDHHRSFYFISITNKTLYNTKTPRKHKKKVNQIPPWNHGPTWIGTLLVFVRMTLMNPNIYHTGHAPRMTSSPALPSCPAVRRSPAAIASALRHEVVAMLGGTGDLVRGRLRWCSRWRSPKES